MLDVENYWFDLWDEKKPKPNLVWVRLWEVALLWLTGNELKSVSDISILLWSPCSWIPGPLMVFPILTWGLNIHLWCTDRLGSDTLLLPTLAPRAPHIYSACTSCSSLSTKIREKWIDVQEDKGGEGVVIEPSRKVKHKRAESRPLDFSVRMSWKGERKFRRELKIEIRLQWAEEWMDIKESNYDLKKC